MTMVAGAMIFGQSKVKTTQYTRFLGMKTLVLWWPLVLCVLTSASASEEELPPPSTQEALGLLASLQKASEGSASELRKMANMYEILQTAALQQHLQRQRLAELEEREREYGEELPVALPLQARMSTLQDSSEYYKDKRGSYMSLCHFKICNMGRKRSPIWSSWGRN